MADEAPSEPGEIKLTERESIIARQILKQLQDSLNKTTAELDRIKKRLSTGKP